MTLEELYRLLRSGHVQSQGIVDTLQDPLVVLDKGFSVLSANPAFFRTFNTEREDTLGRSLFELGDGQWDIPELRALLADVLPKATAIVGYEVSHLFPALGQRTMMVSARRLSHPDDNSTQMLVVFEDVSEQRRADAARDMLVAETRHRMKNLMAVVRALAKQTSVAGRTPEQYRDAFMGRFEAVLNAQEFITDHGSAADFATLVADSLRPIAGARAVIAPGPAVRLTQYQVLPVSMIFHEMATNAVKYGALSNAQGSIHVDWSVEHRNDMARLDVDWREQDGPTVTPPTRRGFGTELIETSLKGEGGEIAFTFEPSGVHARLMIPLEGA